MTSEPYEYDAAGAQSTAAVDHSADESPSRTPSAFASIGLLLGRIVLGAVFLAHGYQKLDQGISAVQENFAALSVPMADSAAIAQTVLELGGGALLIVGGLTRLVGLLLGATMFAAAWFAHREAFFVTEGGLEFVATLGAFALLYTFVGPGRWSLDAVLFKRRRQPK